MKIRTDAFDVPWTSPERPAALQIPHTQAVCRNGPGRGAATRRRGDAVGRTGGRAPSFPLRHSARRPAVGPHIPHRIDSTSCLHFWPSYYSGGVRRAIASGCGRQRKSARPDRDHGRGVENSGRHHQLAGCDSRLVFAVHRWERKSARTQQVAASGPLDDDQRRPEIGTNRCTRRQVCASPAGRPVHLFQGFPRLSGAARRDWCRHVLARPADDRNPSPFPPRRLRKGILPGTPRGPRAPPSCDVEPTPRPTPP